ncbi:MAG: pyruvate kinase [Collinsella stercoris]|uniref:pyruvate kinase n=1 Tax=Collinsella stercoris TaxID=147206 RepID=UPI0039955963
MERAAAPRSASPSASCSTPRAPRSAPACSRPRQGRGPRWRQDHRHRPAHQRGLARQCLPHLPDYEKLPSEAEGSIILIDDGLVKPEVESVDGQDMHCVVLNNGLIGERKGVNIPNVDISLPAVTERDRQDILFGLTQNIDYTRLHPQRRRRDIRQLCRENGGDT